ncbi:MAG: hypothetical protein MJ180_05125 [Candidatus Gastranaerophilales bacterium]|nr:hypothetical protein [Candidatus Gastranaerophilales bacterium]
MDEINAIFMKNSFMTYPVKTDRQIKKVPKDIFEKKDNENISSYIDILYSDNDDETYDNINISDFFKAHLPIKSQKLHFGKFYL